MRSVVVKGVVGKDADWEIYSFDPGTASREDCLRALSEIVPPMQKSYSLIAD